ncbi:MAG: zinc ribbon domain-containing protein, partial [Methylotenera sp.]|nr:zinc ribbon domain-containing protein [Methylotenera sp.]MDP1960321.1 zinc ribbon domain-containing protein [Methylotenera sp.]MDP3942198.1 zinc ribbon domain-containing protein [Methylotenera sp.]
MPVLKPAYACLHAQAQMPLEIRMWTCDKCGTKHDRDINAAINIRNEAQRMITAGIVVTANGGTVSRGAGRKSSIA